MTTKQKWGLALGLLGGAAGLALGVSKLNGAAKSEGGPQEMTAGFAGEPLALPSRRPRFAKRSCDCEG